MAHRRCSYYICKSKEDMPLFRFPVQDHIRLQLWLENSGNAHLMSLTKQQLRFKYLCALHFPPSSIGHAGKLIFNAVPVHYEKDSSNVTDNNADIGVEQFIKPNNCAYHNCNMTSIDISMFRFPVRNSKILQRWLQNSGNASLYSLPKRQLSNKYICALHFPPSSLRNAGNKLIFNAVPVRYKKDTKTNAETTAGVDKEHIVMTSSDMITVKTPTKVYKRVKRTTSTEEILKSSSPSLALMEIEISDSENKEPENNTTQSVASSCVFEEPKEPEKNTTESKSSNCVSEEPTKNLSSQSLLEDNSVEQSQDFPEKYTNTLPRTSLLKYDEGDKQTIKLLQNSLNILLEERQKMMSKIAFLRKKPKNVWQLLEKHKFHSDVSKTLVYMQLRKKTKRAWTCKETQLSLELYGKSPAAYKLLKQQGVLLPGICTIKRWLTLNSPSNTNEEIQEILNSRDHSPALYD